MKKWMLYLGASLLLLLLAACGGEEPTPTPPPPLVVTVEATNTPTPPPPALSFCDVVDPSQISLNTLGLPYPYQVNCVPETPYDASQPPGPMGMPEHIQVNLGTLDPAAKSPLDPVIYIIPVHAYVAMWDAAGDPTVADRVEQLQDLIAVQPQAFPTSGLPVLPVEEAVGANDLAVQGLYLNFGSWDGFRFVGRFEQSPNTVTNQGLRYIFQGFAGENDEVLVTMFWPVSTPFLPQSAADVPQAEFDQLNADMEGYMNQKAAELNQLSASDWNPDLMLLDDVIASLQYGPPQTPGPVPTVEVPTPEPGVPYGVVTAPSGVNVRSGPGSAYPAIGTAPFGAEGAIIGKSADGQWWVTPILGAPNNQGWISAAYVNAFNANDVPAIPAPPPPVPTATPTPLATPVPQINFWSDRNVINQGECTALRWRVENIQAVWVYPQGEDYTHFPVTGVGSRQVCPSSTTTYEMRVQNRDGTVDFRQVTITVNENNPLVNTSWSVSAMNVTGALVPGTSITIFFGSGNYLSGNGGCNSYNGRYAVSGSNISVSGLSSSGQACGADIDQQEALYISLLQAAATYEISDNQLILRNVNGQEILRFARAG